MEELTKEIEESAKQNNIKAEIRRGCIDEYMQSKSYSGTNRANMEQARKHLVKECYSQMSGLTSEAYMAVQKHHQCLLEAPGRNKSSLTAML